MTRRVLFRTSLVGLLMILTLSVVQAAAPPVIEAVPGAPEIPSAREILARLKPGHPRLLLTNLEEFAELKARGATEPQLKAWQASMRQSAQRLLEQPPSKYEIPDGLRLLATSRRVLDRVALLALMYRLEGNTNYARRAWVELEAAANFPDWNPRHFLDTAEMSHAFGLGYDWLYDYWTPSEREMLRRALVTKGLQPALEGFRGTRQLFWITARHNWNQVCNGGIGMAALALADVEPEICGELLRGTLRSLPLAMSEFAPDGAWKEGPGYWNYATSYNVYYLAGLQTALGTDYGLSNMKGFSDTGSFPLYMTGPGDRTFNYADSGDRGPRAAQLFWLARRFDQPACAWYEVSRTQGSLWDLLWYTPVAKSPDTLGLPLDKYFRGSEVVSFRSSWEARGAAFVAFKAGDNKANHSHLDLGSFVFDVLGSRWVVDLAGDDYNLPGYFGGKRWDYYRLRAEGHNTLVINPSLGPDQVPTAAASIQRWKSTAERAFAISDLTAAYAGNASKVLRGVALVNRSQLLVEDEVRASKPAEVWWFLHTPAKVQVAGDGHSATLNLGSAQVEARLLSPAGARLTVIPAEPLPGSPHPATQATNDLRKLAVHLAGITDVRIAITLAPAEKGKSPLPQPAVKSLTEW
jgi:hypothetical protein